MMFSSLQAGFQNILNTLNFAWRNAIKPGEGPYHEPVTPSPREEIFALGGAPLIMALDTLITTYGLHDWVNQVGHERYKEALSKLHTLDWVELKIPRGFLPIKSTIRWLDVGCKNFAYAKGIEAFVTYRRGEDPAHKIVGVEVDPYRLYADGHSRKEYAEAYTRDVNQCQLVFDDVLTHRGEYDVITWFLPFVLLEPCQAWGLPNRLFKPRQMLDHVLNLLAKDGVLLIVNQGPEEYEAQGKLLRELLSSLAEAQQVSGVAAATTANEYYSAQWLSVSQRSESLQPRYKNAQGRIFEPLALGEIPDAFIPTQYQQYGWCIARKS